MTETEKNPTDCWEKDLRSGRVKGRKDIEGGNSMTLTLTMWMNGEGGPSEFAIKGQQAFLPASRKAVFD